MLYIDYTWDCSPSGIILDEEFDSDKLGWKGGDYFQLININGRQYLRKVGDLEKFIIKGAISNGQVSGLVGQPKSPDARIS
jgi:hypothetical protein